MLISKLVSILDSGSADKPVLAQGGLTVGGRFTRPARAGSDADGQRQRHPRRSRPAAAWHTAAWSSGLTRCEACQGAFDRRQNGHPSRMGLRLTPRDNVFYRLFTEAADNVVTGVRLLRELVSAPSEQREQIAAQIKSVENKGDDLVKTIIERLDTSFVTPFDRADIYQLAIRLDDVLDDMEAAADLTVLYRIGDFPPDVEKQVALLCQAAELTARAMPGLRDLTGLTEFWQRANDIEDAGDHVYRCLLAELFDGERDALTVLKLKEIVDDLEAAADGFEHVADVVRSIAVKES
jgi:hypothetical protein